MTVNKRGRPKMDEFVKKQQVGMKLPPYLLHFIDKKGERMRSVIIEEAILKQYSVTKEQLIKQMKAEVENV